MPTLHGTYETLIQDHKAEKMKDDYHWTCEYCLRHHINDQTQGLSYFVLQCWNVSNILTYIIFNKVLVDTKSCILISNYKNPENIKRVTEVDFLPQEYMLLPQLKSYLKKNTLLHVSAAPYLIFYVLNYLSKCDSANLLQYI